MLGRLAGFLYVHRRRVIVISVIGAVIAGIFGSSVAKHMSPYGANDPATQSVQAANRYQKAAGEQIGAGIVALVRSGDVSSAGAKELVTRVAGELRSQPDVARVVSFYDSRNPAMVSRDRRSTYVLAYFKPLSDNRLKDDAQVIVDHFKGRNDVTLGGAAVANAQVNTQVGHDLERSELLVFPLIFLLSLLFFRSLVAGLLPPLLGGLAIVATFFVLRIVASFVDLSVFALNLVTGLGLGLAIDYSLFMVSRYREEAAVSGYGATALRRTLQTAGRTILFSSLTVAAAIASLTIFPQRFLYSMGIAGSLVALLAATLALVVLPAVLAVLGPRVNALAPKRLARAAERDARPAESGAWYRLSRFVMRRPAQIAIASATFLIVARHSVLGCEVHLGRRQRAAHNDERATSRRRAQAAVPAQPHRAARCCRRSARPLTAGQGVGRADRASAERLGRVAGAAGRQLRLPAAGGTAAGAAHPRKPAAGARRPGDS